MVENKLPLLNRLERRIIGVLLEKLLSTPQYYPLTLNSLQSGCNQKNNRNPKTAYSTEEIERGLSTLLKRGFVTKYYPEGARTIKWRCIFQQVISITKERDMAVLAELLLRGPQSKNELKTRASRMRHQISQDQIDTLINNWMALPAPLVVKLSKQPGQRHVRYAHRFHPEKPSQKPGTKAKQN